MSLISFLFMFRRLYKTSVCFYSEGRGACLLLLCECVAASRSVCVCVCVSELPSPLEDYNFGFYSQKNCRTRPASPERDEFLSTAYLSLK